jgi:uncharacterized protein (DUF2141 family)
MATKEFKIMAANKTLLLGFMLLLWASCAQVVRPTGGKSDVKAPEVLKYLPENNSLEFKQKSFSIQFDEFFVVKDVSKQWIISPPLKSIPEYKIKGKTLTITFDDTLKDNTTYNFNFGKSIADVNEGNALAGLSYIFSTGTFIDSIQITGNITQALTNAKEKEMMVLLYQENRCKQDSFPYKILPDYFALGDATGNYTLKYLKPGRYRAIALKDANSNYLFDSFEEAIGFCDTVIDLKANANLDFKVFKEIEQKTYLKNKSNAEYGCFNLIFNKAVPNLEIVPLHVSKQKDWALIEYSKAKDTVNIYLQDFGIDTLKLSLKNNQVVLDTVEFAVLPKEKFSNKSKRNIVPKTSINISPSNGGIKEINSPIRFLMNHPISKINLDSILFFEDTVKQAFILHKKDSVGKKYELESKLLNDSNYKLTILPGAFRDCFGYTNDTIRSFFKVASLESVGNLYLSINADSSRGKIDFSNMHLILQLLNEKGEVLQSQSLSKYGLVSYLNLKPGIYKAQIIVDNNNNKQWDTGNFLEKKQAEKIIFMNGNMNLRANWDLEEEWYLNLSNQ